MRKQMTYETLRNQAYEANMKIPENHLALYTWGNVSAFDKDKGVFAIKPAKSGPKNSKKSFICVNTKDACSIILLNLAT